MTPFRRWPVALLVVAGLLLPAPAALAKYYFYTDSNGSTHMVDGIEKVPREYRKSARPWNSSKQVPEEETQSSVPHSDRPAWMEDEPEGDPEATPSSPPPSRSDLPRDPREGQEAAGSAGVGEIVARAGEALGGIVRGIFPLEGRAALEGWALLFAVALAVRAAASLRARRAAASLSDFADRFEKLVAKGPALSWPWAAARSLEEDLPAAAELVRAAQVGPSTVAAVRTMGGQAVDAGRVDAFRACLADDEVASATRFLLRSAEGVYRHRSVAPWLPSGWLETIFMLPRFLVWRGPAPGDASGIRVLVVLYWLWLGAYALGAG